MSKVSKNKNLTNNSNLICITGFMGSGKSTFTIFLKELGFNVFIVDDFIPVSYTHIRAHETEEEIVCRILLE
ncbi:MAG: hypothetical protein K2F52_01215, partial [Malacoplasma sp.]|nr:hypothetical protein [Malacoplasma sp.]